MIVPMFIFWDVEKLERGGSELITSFWTVLTCAFLCTVLCQALDIRLKQKKKKQNFLLEHLCKIREGGV